MVSICTITYHNRSLSMPSGPKKRRAAIRKVNDIITVTTSTNPDEEEKQVAAVAVPEMASMETKPKESETSDDQKTLTDNLSENVIEEAADDDNESPVESPLIDPSPDESDAAQSVSTAGETSVHVDDLPPLVINLSDQPICEENLDRPTKEDVQDSLKDPHKGSGKVIDLSKEVGHVRMLMEQLLVVSSEISLAVEMGQDLCEVLTELDGSKGL